MSLTGSTYGMPTAYNYYVSAPNLRNNKKIQFTVILVDTKYSGPHYNISKGLFYRNYIDEPECVSRSKHKTFVYGFFKYI